MFWKLTVIALPTLFMVAATVPGKDATPSPSPTQAESETDIRQVIKAQQIAWNRGDINAFMEGYWRSHDTVFVSGDAVTRGWQTVNERYHSKYSDREKMGQLTFSELEVRMFGYDGALVFGRWQLARAEDNPHGRFTLIFRKTKEGWKIVHDHTSSAVDS